MNNYVSDVAVTTIDHTISFLEIKLGARCTNLTQHMQVQFASLSRHMPPPEAHCVMLLGYRIAVGPFDPKKQSKQV